MPRRWLLVAFVLASAPAAASAGFYTGGGDTACCGAVGNAGPWGGADQFSFCIRGATCTDPSHTMVTITRFDGDRVCPVGSYDCAVTAMTVCCDGSGLSDPENCSDYSVLPSVCGGYCGPGQSMTPADESCSPAVQVLGCCLPNEIQVPSSFTDNRNELTVSYGYEVTGVDGGADDSGAQAPGELMAAQMGGCSVAPARGGWLALVVLGLLIRRRAVRASA
jgi:hypothetical protein